MGNENIVLEAPKYGGGRQCGQRPIDVQRVCERVNGVPEDELKLLKEFSSLLRQSLIELPQFKRADKIARLKEISQLSDNYGAQEMSLLVNEMLKKPSDPAMLAKLTALSVHIVSFISSLSRV